MLERKPRSPWRVTRQQEEREVQWQQWHLAQMHGMRYAHAIAGNCQNVYVAASACSSGFLAKTKPAIALPTNDTSILQ